MAVIRMYFPCGYRQDEAICIANHLSTKIPPGRTHIHQMIALTWTITSTQTATSKNCGARAPDWLGMSMHGAVCQRLEHDDQYHVNHMAKDDFEQPLVWTDFSDYCELEADKQQIIAAGFPSSFRIWCRLPKGHDSTMHSSTFMDNGAKWKFNWNEHISQKIPIAAQQASAVDLANELAPVLDPEPVPAAPAPSNRAKPPPVIVGKPARGTAPAFTHALQPNRVINAAVSYAEPKNELHWVATPKDEYFHVSCYPLATATLSNMQVLNAQGQSEYAIKCNACSKQVGLEQLREVAVGPNGTVVRKVRTFDQYLGNFMRTISEEFIAKIPLDDDEMVIMALMQSRDAELLAADKYTQSIREKSSEIYTMKAREKRHVELAQAYDAQIRALGGDPDHRDSYRPGGV